jgi:hypothetical protein
MAQGVSAPCETEYYGCVSESVNRRFRVPVAKLLQHQGMTDARGSQTSVCGRVRQSVILCMGTMPQIPDLSGRERILDR